MRPSSEAEMAEAVVGAGGPLMVRGGGTRPLGTTTGELLETGGLSGVTLYEPGALTMVAQAGTPLAEIEAALEAEGQRLAFEPMDHRALLGTSGKPTIGGAVATNASGPRRVQAGAARDFLLGLRFVDGQGTVVKNGGRVMKNVTGYDLVRLMAGSRGTLGVLTEVGLKVLPQVETEATLTLPGLDAETAVRAMAAGLGSPFEVTGAAHDAAGTHLRIEGFTESVAYRTGRLREVLGRIGEVVIEDDPARSRALWAGVRDVTDFAERPGDVWRLSVRPSAAPGLIARLEGCETRLDWGGGLVWVLAPEGTDLRDMLGAFKGHATRIRGRGESPAFQPEAPELAALSAGLRAKFDPRGLLNPGLMG